MCMFCDLHSTKYGAIHVCATSTILSQRNVSSGNCSRRRRTFLCSPGRPQSEPHILRHWRPQCPAGLRKETAEWCRRQTGGFYSHWRTDCHTVNSAITAVLNPVFLTFSSFTLEVFCYSALKWHFKKKNPLTFPQSETFLAARFATEECKAVWLEIKKMMCVPPYILPKQLPPEKKERSIKQEFAFSRQCGKEPS